ncbi:MAG: nucleotide-binding protein [Fimbriimonadaceae bacterium]
MDSTSKATLASLAKRGRKLIDGSWDPTDTHDEFRHWVEDVATWLDGIEPDSGLSTEWSSLPTSLLVFGNRYDDSPEALAHFYQAVQQRLRWLSSVPTVIANRQRVAAAPDARSGLHSQRVFLVHGHDERVRETVARFLEKLELECIILHEQPNRGRTIIEKFEDYADVAFAVVLLTPDDQGGVGTSKPETYKPRARQNVILELGFFLGALGRSHVCALYTEGVEIPSDYSGVLFVPLDDGRAWRMTLLRELIAAGIPVDANRAFK